MFQRTEANASITRFPRSATPKKPIRRKSLRWIQKQLQIPLILSISFSVGLVFAIFATFCLAFVHRNYDLFKKLAMYSAPSMTENLYREIVFLEVMGLVAGTAILLVSGLLAWRFTTKLLGPLIALRNHIQEVQQGRWHRDQFHYRSTDDLLDTLSSWASLYEKQRKEQLDEIALLEKIKLNPNSQDVLNALEQLIKLKKYRTEKSLFSTLTAIPSKPETIHDSRAAS